LRQHQRCIGCEPSLLANLPCLRTSLACRPLSFLGQLLDLSRSAIAPVRSLVLRSSRTCLVPSARDALTLLLCHHPQAECGRGASECAAAKRADDRFAGLVVAVRALPDVKLATARLPCRCRTETRRTPCSRFDTGFSIAASSAMLESDLFSEARMQAIRRNIARGRAGGPQSQGQAGKRGSALRIDRPNAVTPSVS
jgi:hypothetical protein